LKELVDLYTAEIALLVIGGTVIQHVGSYTKVAQAIRKFFVRDSVLLNRNGATIIALEAVMERMEGTPKEIRLERYFPFDPLSADKALDGHKQTGIAENVRTACLELIIHLPPS